MSALTGHPARLLSALLWLLICAAIPATALAHDGRHGAAAIRSTVAVQAPIEAHGAAERLTGSPAVSTSHCPSGSGGCCCARPWVTTQPQSKLASAAAQPWRALCAARTCAIPADEPPALAASAYLLRPAGPRAPPFFHAL